MGQRFLFGLRGKALEWGLIWAVIFPAYTLFGWNNGIAGSLLALPSWVATFPSIDTVHTTGAQKAKNAQIQGTVVATYTLGAFFGALSCIWIGDRLGRRRTIALGGCVQIVGVILQASSFSLAQLIVGRLITGLGFGALSATAPNWQSECSSAHHRGAAVIVESCFISLGLALQGWISFGIGFAEGSVTWRFPLSMSIFWTLLVLVALPLVPESPRWLFKHGKVEQARDVLSALYDRDLHAPEVDEALMEIEESLKLAGSGRFRDIFTFGELRLFNRTLLASAAGFYQQICGINALAYYQTDIFQSYLHLTSRNSRILAASVFTWQTLCSPLGILTVDRFGRRKLMLASATGMGICMAIVAGASSAKGNQSAIAAAGAFIFLFSTFFPVGFLGLAFLYASEISPLNVRVYITSVSTGTVWMTNFVVAEMTPPILNSIQGRYYILYACINLFLIVPTVYLFFPETNQRTLEEMDVIFRNSHNVFDPVKVSRKLPKHAGLDQEEDAIAAKNGMNEKRQELNELE